MKPELIFVNEHDGLVTLSKEDLERIVDTAYKAGQADSSSFVMQQPWTITPTWDGTTPLKKTDITCNMREGADGWSQH